MTENDTPLVSAADPWSALALLSRIPVPSGRIDPTRSMAASAWSWPLVGALLGLVSGAAGVVALKLGLPATLAAATVVTVSILLTGALHEDGLADTFDGLWGARDRDRRLAIMRDSRIGTYGVLALVLSVLLRWSALSALIEAGYLLAPVIAAAALSRVPVSFVMAALPNARADGLSAGSGRPPAPGLWLGLALGLAAGFGLVGGCALVALFWMALASVILARLARTRIGGQTGDILGAVQQMSEIAALASLAACLA